MDNFFEYDKTSRKGGGLMDKEDDEDFDALNEETFGTVADTWDWDDQNEQLAGLKKDKRNVSDVSERSIIREPETPYFSNISNGLTSLGNSFESSPKASLFDSTALSASPGNSIWTPGPSALDKLISSPPMHNESNSHHQMAMMQEQMRRQMTPSFSLNESQLQGPPGIPPLNHLQNSVHSVTDLERQLRLQQIKNHAASMVTADELERQSRASQRNFPPQQQQQLFHDPRANARQNYFPQKVASPPMDNQLLNYMNQLSLNKDNRGNNHMNNYRNFPNNLRSNNNQQGGYNQQQNYNHQQRMMHGGFNPQQHAGFNQQQMQALNHQQQQHLAMKQQQQQSGYNSRYGYNNQQQQHGFNHHQQHGFNQHQRNDYDNRNGPNFNHMNHRNNNRQYNDQGREGGSRPRRDSELEWEEWERKRLEDPYCGLMTPKQKSWLRNIQTMQLQTDNPYVDDYYYVVLDAKKKRTHPDDSLKIHGLSKLLPVITDPGKENERTYQPPNMENSLGKLQVASVNAPRKIMDIKTLRYDSKQPATEEVMLHRDHRSLLLFIENLYDKLMELEDLERKIAYLPDSPTRDHYKRQATLLLKELWGSVEGSLAMVLPVKKGKTLLASLAKKLEVRECNILVCSILSNLGKLTEKCQEDRFNTLNILWPQADKVLTYADSSLLLKMAETLTALITADEKKDELNVILRSKFGITMLVGLLVKGEELHGELTQQTQWQEFLSKVINLLAYKSDMNCITNTLVRDSSDTPLGTRLPQTTNRLTPPLKLTTSVSADFVDHLARCTDEKTSSKLAAAQSVIKELGIAATESVASTTTTTTPQ